MPGGSEGRVLPPRSTPALELITPIQMSTLRKTSFRIISLAKPLNILVIYSSLAGVKGFQPLSSLFKGIFICRSPTPMKQASKMLRPATPTRPRRDRPVHAQRRSVSRHLHGVPARVKTMPRRAKSHLHFAEFGRAESACLRRVPLALEGGVPPDFGFVEHLGGGTLQRGVAQMLGVFQQAQYTGHCCLALFQPFGGYSRHLGAAIWGDVLCQPFLVRFPEVMNMSHSPVARGE